MLHTCNFQLNIFIFSVRQKIYSQPKRVKNPHQEMMPVIDYFNLCSISWWCKKCTYLLGPFIKDVIKFLWFLTPFVITFTKSALQVKSSFGKPLPLMIDDVFYERPPMFCSNDNSCIWYLVCAYIFC